MLYAFESSVRAGVGQLCLAVAWEQDMVAGIRAIGKSQKHVF
jgi:hypothetical protein